MGRKRPEGYRRYVVVCTVCVYGPSRSISRILTQYLVYRAFWVVIG